MNLIVLVVLLSAFILLQLATSIACVLVDRPRIGGFFFFGALGSVRVFTGVLANALNEPVTDSTAYRWLTSDFGLGVTIAGALGCLLWAWWDTFAHLGGIAGIRAKTKVARAEDKARRARKKAEEAKEDEKQSRFIPMGNREAEKVIVSVEETVEKIEAEAEVDDDSTRPAIKREAEDR